MHIRPFITLLEARLDQETERKQEMVYIGEMLWALLGKGVRESNRAPRFADVVYGKNDKNNDTRSGEQILNDTIDLFTSQ